MLGANAREANTARTITILLAILLINRLTSFHLILSTTSYFIVCGRPSLYLLILKERDLEQSGGMFHKPTNREILCRNKRVQNALDFAPANTLKKAEETQPAV